MTSTRQGSGGAYSSEASAVVSRPAVPYATPSVRSAREETKPQNADVVIVGGGFSGIQAAWDIQKAGLSCVVLEASDRIGGRSRSQKLRSGPGVVELGAGWINETTQPKVFSTAKRLGLEMVEQYTEGDALWQLADGTVLRVKPNSRELSITVEMNDKMKNIFEKAMQDIDIHDPTKYPSDLDVSLETWSKTHGLSDETSQHALRVFLYGILGREAADISIHYFLDYVKSAGGWDSVVDEDEHGAQHLKIKQGTSAVATGLADEMKPDSIFLNSPVDSICQNADGALIHTAKGAEYQCRRVILAIPSNTYGKIKFNPPLPRDKRHVVSRTKPGLLSKMVVTYDSAWWKELGLMGKILSFKEPVSVTFDVSDKDGQHYSLAVFIAGSVAERWAELNELQREESVIEHLADIIGPENAHLARNVLEVNYVNWPAEEFLGGAPTSMMGPGLLAKYASALRESFGNVHIAGGETAYEWKGYLEGALLAGSRAAAEVIELL